MKKNIVFDFDHTLTTFDTIYPFFIFCNRDNLFVKNIKKGIWFIFILLNRLKFISNYKLKNNGIKLFLLGYTKEYIYDRSVEFYHKITFYENILKKFQVYADNRDNIFISSASFYEYLTVFSQKYKNVRLSCSLIEYKHNKVNGLKFNNYKENKLQYFQKHNIEIDVLYTDSFSDRFLTMKSKEIIVVLSNGNMIMFNNYDKYVKYFKGEK